MTTAQIFSALGTALGGLGATCARAFILMVQIGLLLILLLFVARMITGLAFAAFPRVDKRGAGH